MAFEANREFLKDTVRLQMDFSQTDQAKGEPRPPVEKTPPEDAPRISMPAIDKLSCGRELPLYDAIAKRQSHRKFQDLPVTMEELSFLLWSTQGMRPTAQGHPFFRTVPSAGARHTFETYIAALKVEGLEPGILRYLPTTHQLVREAPGKGLSAKLTEATLGQSFVGDSAVVFIWSCVPYRMEWRYGAAAHRVILMDVGHVCQNLYLGCTAIEAGTCAVAAYDQAAMDNLLSLDGKDEFTLYLAPVGKI